MFEVFFGSLEVSEGAGFELGCEGNFMVGVEGLEGARPKPSSFRKLIPKSFTPLFQTPFIFPKLLNSALLQQPLPLLPRHLNPTPLRLVQPISLILIHYTSPQFSYLLHIHTNNSLNLVSAVLHDIRADTFYFLSPDLLIFYHLLLFNKCSSDSTCFH